MALGTSARRPVGQQVAYLRRRVTGAAGPRTVSVGWLPRGSIILRAYTAIVDVFNGTSPTADLGTAADPDAYLAAGDVIKTVGVNAVTLLNSAARTPAADTEVTVTLNGAGMNAGSGDVIVEFIPPDELE